MSVRHDWYQSETKVVVTVMLKDAVSKNYKVDIMPECLHMTADGYELVLNFYRPVDVSKSSHKAYTTKVEITLAKEVGERWESLEKKDLPPPTARPPPIHKKDWDSLAKEVDKSEEENSNGEDALKRLFDKIYSESSPEVKKAMNKSFSESGGTVLSTNWQEVSKDKVDVKPPEGAEFKKWD
ncbi:protein SGT1 homolog [Anastrepha obliqua]|uniref:protein SGT1 homolog n=1 Tax=Anastrepha ludens TaxID=28586 RepID=UPI0023AE8065|nr:protein SGT1 homolog [Anastrepha ludens]XP_054740430.1 protein SGT1 homolog [Anastrepha obliqua]